MKAGLTTEDGRAISSSTLARLVSVTSPRGAYSVEEIEIIAEACVVPRSFMLAGFSPDEPGLGERVEALENQVRALLRREPTPAEIAAAAAGRIEAQPPEVKPAPKPKRGKGRAA